MNKKIISRLKDELSWGLLYAKDFNYRFGYFSKEGVLVKKYFKNPGRVLVLGSGNGREARPISGGKDKIFCVDYVRFYLEAGKKLFASDGISGVEFLQADIYKLPFKRSSFGFIFNSLYTNYASFRIQMLKSLRELICDGGYLLLTTQARHYLDIGNKMGWDKKFFSDWTNIEDPEQISEESTECGFERLETIQDDKRSEYIFSMLRAV